MRKEVLISRGTHDYLSIYFFLPSSTLTPRLTMTQKLQYWLHFGWIRTDLRETKEVKSVKTREFLLCSITSVSILPAESLFFLVLGNWALKETRQVGSRDWNYLLKPSKVSYTSYGGYNNARLSMK